MSAIDRIAFASNRKDEVLNQELARELTKNKDIAGIKEIADNLWCKNKNIQNDCIKVLYEIGYIEPELIAPYVQDFLKLLKSRNNRLIWGGMLALSTISAIKAEDIYKNIGDIYEAMSEGSVITIDNGVKVLAVVAAFNAEYNEKIFPYLIRHLETCRAKEIPQHSESIMPSVNSKNSEMFLNVISKREHLMTAAQISRIKKLKKKLAEND